MEKNSRITMKDGGVDGKRITGNKSTWNHFHGDDLYSGFSWPPRSYSCSFCKREFRSAQALGGHMNVHRRDRARLRQSPPWETHSHSQTTNPHSNPNPFSPSTKLYKFHPMHHDQYTPPFSSQTSTCPSPSPTTSKMLNSSPPVPGSTSSKDEDLLNTLKGFIEEEEEEEECRIHKGKKVMLDLKIGVGNGSYLSDNDDLDLELRLGYS